MLCNQVLFFFCFPVDRFIIIIFDPGTQFPGIEKNYAMQYKKVQKSSWNEPPPSQNSDVARWHCTAESERRVSETKS